MFKQALLLLMMLLCVCVCDGVYNWATRCHYPLVHCTGFSRELAEIVFRYENFHLIKTVQMCGWLNTALFIAAFNAKLQRSMCLLTTALSHCAGRLKLANITCTIYYVNINYIITNYSDRYRSSSPVDYITQWL